MTSRSSAGARIGDAPAPKVAKATVRRVGQVIVVQPVECAVALARLRTERRMPDPRQGGQLTTVPEPLLFEKADPVSGQYLTCWAGLAPAVRAVLKDAGYALDPFRPVGPWPIRDLAPLGASEPVDRPLLDFVRLYDRGLFRYGPGVDRVRLIAQLVLAFPTRTFVVVAVREDDVRRVAAGLKPYVPGVLWATGESSPAAAARVVVATPSALVDHAVKIKTRDAVIAYDAAEAIGKAPRYTIQRAYRARLYGLLALDRRPAPRDADRIAEMFGFKGVVIPRHGHAPRPVAVTNLPVYGGPPLPPGLDTLSLKRQGLWRHGVRNRRVVRLAAAVAAGDGPRLDAERAGLAAVLARVSPGRVLVLVESVDHALTLAERLPGWPLSVGPEVTEAGLSPGHSEALKRLRRAGPECPGRVVSTLAGLDRLDLGDYDVLVRGDGGCGLPAALTLAPSVDWRHVRTFAVIDLDDRHHPVLRRWSRGRRQAYLDRGWAVDGRPAPSAMERFLSSRPGGSS